MATQEHESVPRAEMVGNAFVQSYYTILSDHPDKVHHFYNDTSVISRPDLDGVMSSASTLNGINEMILSLDYKSCRVEILTVDPQESFGDGVILLVTGFITVKDNMRRKFTQLFFLAPQDKGGYVVLNDVFRYVDEDESVSVEISDADDTAPTAPVTPDPEPTPTSNHTELTSFVITEPTPTSNHTELTSFVITEPTPTSNHTELTHSSTAPVEEDTNEAKESSQPLDNGKIPPVENEVAVERSVVVAQNDAHLVSEAASSNVQEDTPKKSYASVVNELNFKKQPFQQRVSPAKPVQQAWAAVAHEATPRPTAAPRPSSNNAAAKTNNVSAKGYSIFVANLPMDATVEQLRQAFEQFGPIKPDGVQVRSYKLEKNCFGFVEFESANSMQSALEVSTIEIGNRKAHIEEKRANNGGGKYPPRKGGFRNDNFRSHGNISGGRGYGRNNFENQGGVLGPARGSSRRSGEPNQKLQQNAGGTAPRQGQAKGGNN